MKPCFQCAQDVGVGVVAQGAGEYPAGMDIGEVQGAGELALQCWAAMRDRIALEEIASSEHFSRPRPGAFAGSPKAGVAGSNPAGALSDQQKRKSAR
jgi:hypothetical protein